MTGMRHHPPSWSSAMSDCCGSTSACLGGGRAECPRWHFETRRFDVFGDGSATLLSTPGHTPGHQSFLVHLDKTGWLLLTGDAAHFKDNWDNDRVPSMNTSAEQTHISHARLAGIVAEKKAALWINHDLPTFDSLKHSPDFYE